MSIEFRNVYAAPLAGLNAVAPAGVIIGVVGQKNSGVSELLKLAGGVLQPEQGEIVAAPERRFVALGEPLNLAPAAVVALDQALAIQDAIVRARTLTGLDRLRRSGCTILLASHEERLLERLCDEVWWLEAGALAAKGDPSETLSRYHRFVADRVRSWGDTIPPRLAPTARFGDGRAEVISLDTLGSTGESTIVCRSGEMMSVNASVRFHEAVEDPVFGILIRTRIGFEVYGTNTELERAKIGPQAAGETINIKFSFLCDLCPQAYRLTVALHDPDGTPHDWLDDAIEFTVVDDRRTAGVANLRASVTVEVAPRVLPQ